jgi:hypothetical protein
VIIRTSKNGKMSERRLFGKVKEYDSCNRNCTVRSGKMGMLKKETEIYQK